MKIFRWSGLGTVILGILLLVISINFATKWYKESIRSKSEIRQEILDEIKNDGQSIYKVEDYKQLHHNTELVNKWIEKNPKDAEKFLRFKDGYESR